MKKLKLLASALTAIAVCVLGSVALATAEDIEWCSRKGILLGTFTLMVSTAAALIAAGMLSEEVK